MLETYLSSPITRRRLRAGAAADHIDAFAHWLHLHGYKPTSIDNRLTSLGASLFIRFLRQQGKIPPPAAGPSVTEQWPVLGEFRSWMWAHRGLTETTLDVYQGILVGLLDTLGDDARAYSA